MVKEKKKVELYLRKDERLEDINGQIRLQLQTPKGVGQRTMKSFNLTWLWRKMGIVTKICKIAKHKSFLRLNFMSHQIKHKKHFRKNFIFSDCF